MFHALFELIGAVSVDAAHEGEYRGKQDQREEKSLAQNAYRVPVPHHHALFLHLNTSAKSYHPTVKLI